jgi:osmotically-inducible protein OsmY
MSKEMQRMQQRKAEVRQAVLDQLRADARVDAHDLDVQVSDGQVTLRGMAPSYRSKWAAAEAARRVRGVYDVDNEIEVRVAAPPADERITNDIRTALVRDADLDPGRIQVEVHGGRVTLRGSVPTVWSKARAEEDARWTRGVVRVHNELAVEPARVEPDAQLQAEVERALQRDAAVNAEAVNVTVQERRATLSGLVQNWSERYAALEAASHVPGIVDVADELQWR